MPQRGARLLLRNKAQVAGHDTREVGEYEENANEREATRVWKNFKVCVSLSLLE